MEVMGVLRKDDRVIKNSLNTTKNHSPPPHTTLNTSRHSFNTSQHQTLTRSPVGLAPKGEVISVLACNVVFGSKVFCSDSHGCLAVCVSQRGPQGVLGVQHRVNILWLDVSGRQCCLGRHLLQVCGGVLGQLPPKGAERCSLGTHNEDTCSSGSSSSSREVVAQWIRNGARDSLRGQTVTGAGHDPRPAPPCLTTRPRY
ncbi:hypothetical protein E2C01_038254 [Portunus trituberculatus]|uniref:Uncharacterized protein n=1 Tax=Portunus trituberculatus TaxID=210409 RepID=A0A5B7FGC3_PORTR|nr:hypothetical protein [Portunus trituberculatus]